MKRRLTEQEIKEMLEYVRKSKTETLFVIKVSAFRSLALEALASRERIDKLTAALNAMLDASGHAASPAEKAAAEETARVAIANAEGIPR